MYLAAVKLLDPLLESPETRVTCVMRRMWCTSGAPTLGVIRKVAVKSMPLDVTTPVAGLSLARRVPRMAGDTPSPVLTLQRKRISQACEWQVALLHSLLSWHL